MYGRNIMPKAKTSTILNGCRKIETRIIAQQKISVKKSFIEKIFFFGVGL